MPKKVLFLVFVFLVYVLCFSVFAEEEFVITTYYPSPYGSYNELQTNKFVVGDANGDGSLTSADQPTRNGAIRLKPQAGEPSSWSAGAEGEVVYSGSRDTLYVNNGSKWVAQGGGAPVVATFYGMSNCPSTGGTWTKLYDGYITTFSTYYYAGASFTPVMSAGNSLCVQPPISQSITIYQFWVGGWGYGGYNLVSCCVCIRTE